MGEISPIGKHEKAPAQRSLRCADNQRIGDAGVGGMRESYSVENMDRSDRSENFSPLRCITATV